MWNFKVDKMEEIKIKKQSKFREKWNSYSTQEKILLPIFHIILLLFAIWTILPFAFTFINAFKEVTEYNHSAVSMPTFLKWENFKLALNLEYRNTNVPQMFFNTIIFVVTFTIANIGSSLFSAYALSRFEFPGKGFLYGLAITVQIIPIFGSIGSSYLLADKLGLVDNIWLLWVIGAGGFDYTFLIVYSYFVNVDRSYSEAAKIDGAGNWTVFTKIMIPMVTPAILAQALTSVITLWNNYTTPLIFLPTQPTLSTGLYNLRAISSYKEGGMPAYFAAIVISIIPILIIFVLTQRKLFKINVEGGVKG